MLFRSRTHNSSEAILNYLKILPNVKILHLTSFDYTRFFCNLYWIKHNLSFFPIQGFPKAEKHYREGKLVPLHHCRSKEDCKCLTSDIQIQPWQVHYAEISNKSNLNNFDDYINITLKDFYYENIKVARDKTLKIFDSLPIQKHTLKQGHTVNLDRLFFMNDMSEYYKICSFLNIEPLDYNVAQKTLSDYHKKNLQVTLDANLSID